MLLALETLWGGGSHSGTLVDKWTLVGQMRSPLLTLCSAAKRLLICNSCEVGGQQLGVQSRRGLR